MHTNRMKVLGVVWSIIWVFIGSYQMSYDYFLGPAAVAIHALFLNAYITDFVVSNRIKNG